MMPPIWSSSIAIRNGYFSCGNSNRNYISNHTIHHSRKVMRVIPCLYCWCLISFYYWRIFSHINSKCSVKSTKPRRSTKIFTSNRNSIIVIYTALRTRCIIKHTSIWEVINTWYFTKIRCSYIIIRFKTRLIRGGYNSSNAYISCGC